MNKFNIKTVSAGRLLQNCVTATLISATLLLTGCMGVYEGGFECPAGVGVGCKSISEVNDLVNAGELPKAAPSLSAQKAEIWYSPLFIREHVRYRRVHGKNPF